MKYKTTLGLLAAVGVLASTSCQAALSLNFGSVPGGNIEFGGAAHTFNFNSAASGTYAGSQWRITSVSGGLGDSISDRAVINNGPWTYGSITTSGSKQTATVTSANLGALVLSDGLGGTVTGDVSWIQIGTTDFAGAINAALQVNLTNLKYTHPSSAPESDLLGLVHSSEGKMIVTFQFSPGKTLTQLSQGAGGYKSSFSGSVSPVPEPTTMLAGALLLLPFAASTIRFARKNRKS